MTVRLTRSIGFCCISTRISRYKKKRDARLRFVFFGDDEIHVSYSSSFCISVWCPHGDELSAEIESCDSISISSTTITRITNNPHHNQTHPTREDNNLALKTMEFTTATPKPAKQSTPATACEDFMRQGYVLLPEVLDATTVAQLRTIIDKNAQGKHTKKKHVIYC